MFSIFVIQNFCEMTTKKMKKKPRSYKKSGDTLEREYNEIFSALGIDISTLSHEWNKAGDSFKKFSLYQEYSTPILVPNTGATTTNA